MQTSKDISVCFPSRGRPDSLREAVESLLDLAAAADAVEILVAIDPDDVRAAGPASLPSQVRVWTAPRRYGYRRLHEYLNALAAMAAGTWLSWWNDDMRMTTAGWDAVVRAHRPAILWPEANHVPHANICPMWPRAWSDVLGRVSPTMHLDTYLHWLGETLGRHDRIAVRIVHDRADVTGGHDDRTYREGRRLLGPEGMSGDFPFDRLHVDAAIIRRALRATCPAPRPSPS